MLVIYSISIVAELTFDISSTSFELISGTPSHGPPFLQVLSVIRWHDCRLPDSDIYFRFVYAARDRCNLSVLHIYLLNFNRITRSKPDLG